MFPLSAYRNNFVNKKSELRTECLLGRVMQQIDVFGQSLLFLFQDIRDRGIWKTHTVTTSAFERGRQTLTGLSS